MDNKIKKAEEIDIRFNSEMDDIMMLSDDEYKDGYEPTIDLKDIFGSNEYFSSLDLLFNPDLIYRSYKKINEIEKYVDKMIELFNKFYQDDFELVEEQIAIFNNIDNFFQNLIAYLKNDIDNQKKAIEKETSYYQRSELNKDLIDDIQSLNNIINISNKVKQAIKVLSLEIERPYGGR